MRHLSQPERDAIFLPRDWLQRYDAVQVTRGSDGGILRLSAGSSILSFLDFNPRWFVDRLVESRGNALFTLGLDLTNSCTDACPMCFTMAKRNAEGLYHHLDIDLTLRRIAQLREWYPETFRLAMLSGSGEPLNLPGVATLMDGITEAGVSIRVYTAGKNLRKPAIREALLRAAVVVRVSLDAVDEETFQAVHAASDLAERIESLRQLVMERDAMGGRTLIGTHFVIQKANAHQIVPFAEQARDIGCDFVSFSQETYGTVAGGFTEPEFQRMLGDLAVVEGMHTDAFGVIVPTLTSRPTVLKFDKEYVATPEVLDRCHHSRHHIFFGVRNDFSACCLAGMDADFKRASYVGRLADDTTMSAARTVVERGVGAALGRSARLSCNACVMNGYNKLMDRLFAHLDGEDRWDCELLPYTPGQTHADDYEFTVGGRAASEVLSARPGGAATTRRSLPVVNRGMES